MNNAERLNYMARLTYRSNTGVTYFQDHEQQLKLEPCEVYATNVKKILDKLYEYEELEEQGRIIKLPVGRCDNCKHLDFNFLDGYYCNITYLSVGKDNQVCQYFE